MNQTTEAAGALGKKLIMGLSGLFTVLLVAIILLLFRSCAAAPAEEPATVVLEPDFATIDLEPNAVPLADLPDMDAEERTVPAASGGGSVTVAYMDTVTYSLSSRQLTMFYQNPTVSTHSVVVQVILQNAGNEYLLAQSGILNPGYQITSLPAADDAPALTNGGYSGKLKLLFYDTVTGERAIVDTDIPCTVVVES